MAGQQTHTTEITETSFILLIFSLYLETTPLAVDPDPVPGSTPHMGVRRGNLV